MWHVALQCHAGGDILLTLPLFSYYHEVDQNVSHLTHTHIMCVRSGCVVLPQVYSTLRIEFCRHDGEYNPVL